MKRILVALLVLSLMSMLVPGLGLAESDWLFIPTSQTQSLSDVAIGSSAVISGYASITPTQFSFQNKLGFYRAGTQSVGSSEDYYRAGEGAKFAVLKMDIQNAGTTARDYLAAYTVRIYCGATTYGGWAFQQDYGNASIADITYGQDSGMQSTNWVINAADNFTIAPGQTGHYVFGSTLPDAAVDGSDPLRMVITLDGNEITYNVERFQPVQTLAPIYIPVVTEAPTPRPTPKPTPKPQTIETYSGSGDYVVASGGDSNIRSGPGLDYNAIGTMPKGSSAAFQKKTSVDDRGVTWYKIKYDGQTGWVSSKYTKLKSGSSGGGSSSKKKKSYTTVEATDGKTHIRTGPGLDYDDVGVLHVGETLSYLGEKSTDDRGVVWYKVKYKGKSRWVSSKYTTLY